MSQPVSWEARRTFCPRRPIASESWLSGTTTSMRLESSSSTTLVTSAGAERVDDEGGGIRVPLDDVDLLALQLAYHRLHALAAHADAGADGIDRAVLGDDGDLGPGARIAGHRLDLHDAVVDLGDFLREQLGHELRPRAGEEDLGPPLLAPHVVDEGADAVAEAHVLARDHLVAADNPLGAAEIDDNIAVLHALDGAVADLADAILVLAELALALGLAHLLHDHLLGVLRRHAAEIQGRQRFRDQVAHLGLRLAARGVRERHLGRLVLDRLDHLHDPRELRLAGLGVDLAADIVLAAVAGLGRLLDRVFHRRDHDSAVDRLLARHRVGDLQQLEPVRADPCLRHST